MPPERPPTLSTPREALTADVRERVGVPNVKARPYRWKWAMFVCAIAAGPMWLAGLYALLASLCAVALVLLPALSRLESREAGERERLYLTGREAVARVIEVEPPGERRRDHVVRFEFFTGDTADTRVRAAVVGAPIAQRGLKPGEDVVIVYDPLHPTRCLLVDRIGRDGRVGHIDGASRSRREGERLLH
jgi:hypothetical protein